MRHDIENRAPLARIRQERHHILLTVRQRQPMPAPRATVRSEHSPHARLPVRAHLAGNRCQRAPVTHFRRIPSNI